MKVYEDSDRMFLTDAVWSMASVLFYVQADTDSGGNPWTAGALLISLGGDAEVELSLEFATAGELAKTLQTLENLSTVANRAAIACKEAHSALARHKAERD